MGSVRDDSGDGGEAGAIGERSETPWTEWLIGKGRTIGQCAFMLHFDKDDEVRDVVQGNMVVP